MLTLDGGLVCLLDGGFGVFGCFLFGCLLMFTFGCGLNLVAVFVVFSIACA